MTQDRVTQADREEAKQWRFIECMRCSEYMGEFVDDLALDFANHRIAAEQAALDRLRNLPDDVQDYVFQNTSGDVYTRNIIIDVADALADALQTQPAEQASQPISDEIITIDKIAGFVRSGGYVRLELSLDNMGGYESHLLTKEAVAALAQEKPDAR